MVRLGAGDPCHAASGGFGMHNTPPAGHEVWNEGIFTDLSGLIGSPKAQAILIRFQGDLNQRFGQLGDREALRRDAHAVTSMAGMLGFKWLSGLAKTLELACQGGGDIAPSLSAFMQARQAVSARLRERIPSS